MVKKYIFFLILVQTTSVVLSQVAEALTLADFDLKGQVKTCAVLTDYGKELLEFDKAGRLLKIVTQYNENDQDITLFKYANGKLVEKRLESYKNDQLDLQTSMANFFEFDTIAEIKKVTEKIISYDKAFFEEQEFHLDKKGRVEKIIISHEDGVDEKRVEHTDYKGELTTTTFLNGVLEKSIRISEKKTNNGNLTLELVKDFVDGEPEKAVERQRSQTGVLLSEQFFVHDSEKNQFEPNEKRSLIYKEGVLEKEIVTRGNATSEKEYIFQFDDNEAKNWVKKIITPDNTYTTRRIVYFKPENVLVKTMN